MIQVQVIESTTIVNDAIGLLGYSDNVIHNAVFEDADSALEYVSLYMKQHMFGKNDNVVASEVLSDDNIIVVEKLEFEEFGVTHTETRIVITEL